MVEVVRHVVKMLDAMLRVLEMVEGMRPTCYKSQRVCSVHWRCWILCDVCIGGDRGYMTCGKVAEGLRQMLKVLEAMRRVLVTSAVSAIFTAP